jgi:CRISPR/Cas system CSM-associated protein Csm3 (group 7 of RAMP superfamily)
VIVNYNGVDYLIPYIPSTSFKGVLRSTVEVSRRKSGNPPADFDNKVKEFLSALSDKSKKIFRENLEKEVELLANSGIIPYNYKDLVKRGDEGSLKEVLRVYFDVSGWNSSESCYSTSDLDRCENVSLIEDEDRRKFRELWNRLTGRQPICRTCRLYGTSGLRASVRFSNFYPIDPFPIRIDRLTHVSIDRRTWASSPQKLYNEEVISMGVRFLGFALLLKDEYKENILDDLKLLSDKAERVEVTLGARGSVGYGMFSLKFGDFEVELSDKSILGNLTLKFKVKEGVEYNVTEKLKVLNIFFPSYLISSIEVVGNREGAN